MYANVIFQNDRWTRLLNDTLDESLDAKDIDHAKDCLKNASRVTTDVRAMLSVTCSERTPTTASSRASSN
jgi:hypothetical protein